MSINVDPMNVVHGEVKPKECRGFPEGEITFAMAPDEFLVATVATPSGPRRFYVAECAGCWWPYLELSGGE